MSAICGYRTNYIIEKINWLNMVNSMNKRGKNVKEIWKKNIAFANLNNSDCMNFLYKENILITIDGEIENITEICEKLNIHIDADAELIEYLYKEYGEKFVDFIEGAFAIALYDKNKDVLILVRDKIGVKPIYYFIDENNICFASELKAIIKNPKFKKKINNNALSMYFRYSYINPPNTIYDKIYKLEHGHYLIWEKGKIQNKVYWDGIEKFNTLSSKNVNNFNEAKTNVEKILFQEIQKIVDSSEKFGVYLSGGIDSSLVASMAQKISKEPINTYTIGFLEKERNEAENSKKIAKYLGTNHHELYINESDVLKIMQEIPEYYDEPFADASEIPTIILNKFASKNGVKLAITGDGADQLFCGSNIYDKEYFIQNCYRIFNPFKIKIGFISNMKYSKISRILRILYNNSDIKNQTQIDIIARDDELENLFKDDGEKRYNFEHLINSKSWQVKRMIVDVNTFLANRLNTKTDRPSSTNNISIKSPFLTNELIEYSFKVPQKFKYFKRNKKYILKKILYDYLPKQLFNNKKKGFGIPIKKWLNTYLYEDLIRVSKKEFIEKQNIFNYDKLVQLLSKIKESNAPKCLNQIIWNFYIFQLWYIKYMEN